jgi:hypothetical protein
MADPQVVSEWLKKADEDFEFASSIIGIRSPLSVHRCP